MSASTSPADLVVVVDLPSGARGVVVPSSDAPDLAGLPPGPLTTGELTTAVSWRDRDRYRRLWLGMYRREDQVDGLRLRSLALARSRPDGVLRGRSAALLWGDDTAPTEALPEIWLPIAQSSRPGRVYRSGALASVAVTEVEGVRVTTPLRTCRDLAADLPAEDAVVAVERLCARDPSLVGRLRAVAAHPAGGYDDPLRQVVALLDPRSISVDETRVRAVLAASGFGGFDYGHQVQLGRTRVELPLADPALRCAVFVQPVSGPRRTCDERTARELRRAGWTLVLVRPGRAVDLTLAPAPGSAPGSAPGLASAPGLDAAPGPDLASAPASVRAVARLLVERWPSTLVREPLDVAPAADPHGIWAG